MCFFFFFNDTATTEIYTLSLHDALPIFPQRRVRRRVQLAAADALGPDHALGVEHVDRREVADVRSEEHTSELQSQSNLVCRLLLEKKKTHDHRTQTRQRITRMSRHVRSS